MSVEKVYEFVRIILEELDTAGLADWSERIRDSVSSGATGGEVFMAVRHTLQELNKAITTLPESIKYPADMVIELINASRW